MGRFARKDPKKVANTQAANVMRRLQGNVLLSVGTVRNYEEALSRVAQYANQTFSLGLRDLTPAHAILYLTERSESVGQKTLDMERQAMQVMMQHVSGQLQDKATLPVIKAERPQILRARAYTEAQVSLIQQAQRGHNALATRLAYAAGLRAHELLTLRPASERSPSPRPAHPLKFLGREGVRYTVEGKGGLIRDVLIPHDLAAELDSLRLSTPDTVTDRQVHYQRHYAISGGRAWSTSFSRAAKQVLGWSEGAHGVRHSYAQARVTELQQQRLSRAQALAIVSQEMGHFRPDITEVYLR